MTIPISSQITTALVQREREVLRAAAELVWRAALVDGGYSVDNLDPLAVNASLVALGRDTRWFAGVARQLRLMREGEAAEAPGGAVDRAKDALTAATAALDAQAAKVKAAEAALAEVKRATFDLQTVQINAIKQQDAARQVVATGEERRSSLYNDETLRHVGGWAWLVSAKADAIAAAKAKAAQAAEGGA